MTDKGRILAVDDTLASLKLLRDMLQAENYEVLSAASGELALNSATNNPPDLVLLDIRMPEMDGYEVCRRLKSQPETRDVPVIFVSAASETGDKVQGFELGAVDYVTKPYQREELLARVHTHIELGRLRNRLEELVAVRTAELQQSNAALQKSNADLAQFAYSVSHDMRQPLRMVTGHLQLLAIALSDKLEQDDKVNLNFALEGAKRMDAMIVSLLEYSRVGRLTQPKKLMQSRAALEEAMQFLKPAIVESTAAIAIEGDWPELFASPDELSRLFQNLIGNALYYHQPEQPPRIEISSSVTAGKWQVRIVDHGIGIDPAQIDRLFQFFSRLQSRSRFEGSGMGLALCRRIVEHHNGCIWAESEGEGKGCTFTFELPTSEQNPP